jgi:DnaK suppressor protein
MTLDADGKRSKGQAVDIQRFRDRLLALETELSGKIARGVETARETADDQAESGDRSVVEELRDEYFILAQTDSEILAQVRAALARIEDGTYGRCAVDGSRIEEARLEAVPWTPYCTVHQQDIEAGMQLRTPKS